MEKEDKELLFRDICARLRYGAKATTTSNGWNGTYTITGYANDRIYLDCPVYDNGDDEWLVELVKPYLRPMSSMTDEERKYFHRNTEIYWNHDAHKYFYAYSSNCIDWLLKNHFDYHGLIEKGLALEAPEGMYDKKEK